MTEKEINTIKRFGERIPDNFVDHWNQVLDSINSTEKYISELELTCFHQHIKLLEQVKYWKLLKLWIENGKFTKKHGVINFADVAISKILPK